MIFRITQPLHHGGTNMDPETGCGLPSTGQKARLLIGAFSNSIDKILAAAVRKGN